MMYALQKGDIMKDKKDLSKVSLIQLVMRLTDIDNELNEYSLRKNKIQDKIESIKYEYNDIIYELYNRFPPLMDDPNIQPKVMKKKK